MCVWVNVCVCGIYICVCVCVVYMCVWVNECVCGIYICVCVWCICVWVNECVCGIYIYVCVWCICVWSEWVCASVSHHSSRNRMSSSFTQRILGTVENTVSTFYSRSWSIDSFLFCFRTIIVTPHRICCLFLGLKLILFFHFLHFVLVECVTALLLFYYYSLSFSHWISVYEYLSFEEYRIFIII